MTKNTIYNAIMNNLLISGTKACAVIPRELMSIDPEYQRVENRNHAKIAKMHKNFDHMLMDALLVVPHPEDYSFSIVDGYGRFMASEGILDDLECIVITTAPKDPKERRKFEASIFARQSLYTEKVSLLQTHKANLLLENPIALDIQEVLDEYNLKIVSSTGQRNVGILGSYAIAWKITKTSGKYGLKSVVETCHKAGYTMEPNGLNSLLMCSLYKIYTFYGEVGLRKLIPIMRETKPTTLNAKALAVYPERPNMALALYFQDKLVSQGEIVKFNNKGKKITS